MENAMATTQPCRGMRTGLPGKRTTSLSLSSDVLDAAKQININISQVCDNLITLRRHQPHTRSCCGATLPAARRTCA